MIDLEQLSYLERRVIQERDAAILADNPAVKKAHAEMARRYTEQIGRLRNGETIDLSFEQ